MPWDMMNNTILKKWSSKDVYILIPNLIGYVRALLVIVAFCLCFSHPYWFIVLYGVSQLLDSLDGYIARLMNQGSAYGAMLDMVLDRASTTALLVILSNFYPAYTRCFIIIILLDIVSHFTHVYSALSYGKKSHKFISGNQYWMLRIYYACKPVLFILCVGSEAYLLWLYMQYFEKELNFTFYSSTFVYPLLFPYLFGFLFVIKQIINIVQLLQAVVDMVRLDTKD